MSDSVTTGSIPRRSSSSLTASPALNRALLSLLDYSPDCVVCIDRDWNFSFANQQAITFLNSGPLVGENLFELFPGNLEEPYNSSYRATMDRGIPSEFEAFYGAPLNQWFKVFARPFDGGIIVFFSDITARKKAEARRDANARQLEQVLEATTDGVVSFSHDWTFTYLNRSARELLSMKGDLIGRNLWEEFPAALAGNFRYHLERAMIDRVPSDLEDFYPEPLNMWLNVQCRPSDDGIVVFFRDVTRERKARQALVDQQNTLAFVQETARVATWRADIAARTVVFAPGSYPVFGHPIESLRTFDDVIRAIHPDDIQRVLQTARDNLHAGSTVIVDFRVIAADGSILWVEARGLPVFNEHTVTTHVLGMFTDITSRRQNLEELAASEERYRVLADLNPQAIWMSNPEGRIVYANQGFLDYIGHTLEQASSGIGWLNGFHTEDRARVLEAWTQSVATGEEYELEARLVRASDGEARWWWIRALPVRDDSGKILNWIGVAMDIHDRKTSAEALRAEQEETERERAVLEAIYDTAPIGLALFDPVEFRYLRVNDRQAETIGLPKDRILGRRITDIAPLKGLHELFQQVAAGFPVRNRLVEGELPTRPGEHRYWNVSYSPICDADDKVEAIAAVVQEITNQKKAEAALIQSEKLAAVGRLASSISHEINNPLEAITNIFYLIERDTSLSPELKPLVQMAQSELSRVCQIATQTLRFHRQAVRATHVTAQQLVQAVLNLYQGRLLNTRITVEAQYASATPILCLENDIRQVLNNLIANAIDAMRANGGRLLVRAHDTVMYSEAKDGSSSRIQAVRITVADTGHGMTPEVRARIFEPFYTTKDLNGTGLGLWISAGIVARHKGRITLRTSVHPVHHGTIFSLTLPTEQEPVTSTI